MREINLLKQKGFPFSNPAPRQGQLFSNIMAVLFVLLLGGVAYFYLTIHLPLRQSITQMKIDLARSRKIIVTQEHSLNDLSKKASQCEATLAQLKQESEPKSTVALQKKEGQEVKEAEREGEKKDRKKAEDKLIISKELPARKAEKKEEKPGAVASISKHHPYVLHIASFRKPKAPLSQASLWQKRGYTAFVVLTQVPNKGCWYRIYLNRFESLAQAKRLALKLKREKLLDNAIPMRLPYALEPLESGEGIWQRLKRKGYSPYTLVPGKTFIGAYAARHEAEEASRRLADEGFPNRVVIP